MTPVRILFQQYKAAGLVTTQNDFSVISGRKGNWASGAMTRNLDMPLDALVSCYCHLLNERDEGKDTSQVPKLLRTIWHHICVMVEDRHAEITRANQYASHAVT